jgi:hypothetical protein
MEVEETLIIDKERYKNLLNMLNAPDQENAVVAIQSMENMVFEKNRIQILMLKKNSKVLSSFWKETSPVLYKNIESTGMDPEKIITYKGLLTLLKEQGRNPKELQFYISIFQDYLLEEMHALGYNFLEEVEIIVKFKDE